MNKIKLTISLYRIFSRAYFYLPFLTIFFYFKGFNILEISLVMALYGLSSFIFATFFKNMLQKNVSYKRMFILGEACKLLGLALLIISENIITYGIAQAFLGAGYSIGAGIDSFVIYQMLNDEATTFQAKSNSYMFNTLLISGLIGSWLFDKNIYYPIMATAICTLIEIIILTLMLPNSLEKSKNSKTKELISLKDEEKILVLSYAVLRGIILSLFTGFIPYYFFVDLEIPTYFFIVILTSYTLIASIASKKIPKYQGNKILFSIGALAISLLLFLLKKSFYTIIATIFLGVASGVIRPVVANKLKQYKNPIYALDLAEKIYALINFIFLVIGGILYYYCGFSSVVILSIAILIIYIIRICMKNLSKRRKI